MPATHFVQAGNEEMADSERGPGESQQRKHFIKEKFRKEMGLLVDVPKPGGSGTTNNGNTARRFFSRPNPIYVDCGNRRNTYSQMFRHLASTFFQIYDECE
jgi:hypothetical protein